MSISGKTTTKEVCTSCKCIVKERPIQLRKKCKKPEKAVVEATETVPTPQETTCKALIKGEIILPAGCCGCSGGGTGPEPMEPKRSNECVEDIYQDAKACLQKCFLAGKTQKNNR